LALLLALASAGWPLAVHADDPLSTDAVASEIMCLCGCGLTVAACRDSMTCSMSEGMVREIGRQIDDGKSKQEILDYFAATYGEQVLALPRKSGFSLTAWAVPFLAMGVGAVGASFLAWIWARRRPVSREEQAKTAPRTELSPYEERVEEDLHLLE
jgi:cytochrome c-type biogenesis protein CcmH